MVQLFPQIPVDHRFLARGDPVLSLPGMDPAGDAILDVLRICHDLDGAALLQSSQALDGGGQLHPVIGGVRRVAVHLAFVRVIAENAGPAARSRVPEAGAIGDQSDLFHPAKADSSWWLKNSSTISRIR